MKHEEIPSPDFALDLTQGAVKEAAAGVKSRDLWQVPLEDLRVLEQFNARIPTAAHHAKIREIADSIKREGYHQHKPLAVYVARENGKSVFVVYGGHRRYAAALLAKSEEAPIRTVPVITAPQGTTMEDLTAALYTDNTGVPLQPYEIGIVCKRLQNYGWTTEDIASKFHIGTDYVDDLLLLVGAPKAIRDMVINEEISANLAIKKLRQHGEKAREILQQTLRNAQAAGKTRATEKFEPGALYRSTVKRTAPVLADTLASIRQDAGYDKLSEDLRGKIDELLEQLERAKTESAPT